MPYTRNEQLYFDDIESRITALRGFLNTQNLPPDTDILGQFAYVEQVRTILGNSANLQSFLSMMLAKQYLRSHFDIEAFDAAEKAQGAPGLDIDMVDRQGNRIVGEIKTTVPYGETDFGSAQKTSIRKDFAKLNAVDATHKFFFVTDARAYQYVTTKYREEIPQVKVVLLIDATEQESK